ncbi:chromodomain-helicase [Diplogelasinospora grovesii]|uniref:Chromodomain-helicase n=1 Tax=Diplogelasinospora grovesii TaxID=303347 RepID=A0AAN6NIS9_9PEZI|nr:chromodomain-helicase [Diplogelasinospora grovesii]
MRQVGVTALECGAMAKKHSKGFLSSDDELTVAATDELPAFEFQSDLSDDDFAPAEDTVFVSAAPEDTPVRDLVAPNAAPEAPMDMFGDDDGAQMEWLTNAHVSNSAGSVAGSIIARATPNSTSVNGSSASGTPTVRRIEVALPWIPPEKRAEFARVEVEDDELGSFDGRSSRRKRRHESALEDVDIMGTGKRRRDYDDAAYDDDFDEDSGEDFDAEPRPSRQRNSILNYTTREAAARRSTRTSTRASSLLVSSEGEHRQSVERTTGSRKLRPRQERPLLSLRQSIGHDHDRDELQDSEGDDGDPSYRGLVTSDIVQPKRRKKLRKLSSRRGLRASRNGNSDIEFEARRSSRANKNTKSMMDSYADDDDDIYYVVEETRGAPKVSTMREVFQPTTDPDFKEAHRWACDTCGLKETSGKGSFVPCQGCSNSYHKACLPSRSTREHCVTKVAADSFVLQCRFCIGIHKKRDERTPSYDTCQSCHMKAPSCAPFSQKKTPKQEEKIRLENDGVDPITPVAPNLIDNADNVLFRCHRCRRGWHYEHLPHPNGLRDPAVSDPLNLRKHRREEYQTSWQCKECMQWDGEKIDRLVAWRPANRSSYTKGQNILDFTEDEIEYLIKWERKSYVHCVWMPGAWVAGVAQANMRNAFVKRTFGEAADEESLKEDNSKDNLLRWTEDEAIHDAWVTPDIILDVEYAPRSREYEAKYRKLSLDEKFEDDLSRIFHVVRIYVKFEGLGYDDVVWDTPPDPGSGALYDAYVEAYREYLRGRHFKPEPLRNIKDRIEEFRNMDFETQIQVKEQPQGLRRGKLMDYQVEGLNWMLYNFRHDRSVILADEMGLGKTVQVVALLSSFIQDNPKIWPFLIVVPNSTCPNWRREIKKWAPDLRVVAYYGGRASQNLAYKYELFPDDSRELKAHVVIMSYDSAKDTETRTRFASVKWPGLVVDEAQALKNDANGLYKALTSMNIRFKLLLTGTPLQNNKRELFNLLQFIDPTVRADELDVKFGEITKDNLPELHDMIRPYFLRRTKAQVLTFLPPMAQIIIPVSMSVLQEKLYKSIMEKNPQLIRSIFTRGKLKANERGSLSNILMQLRKCLCHPFVYSQAIEDRNASPEMMRRNLVEASSKLVLLELMLPNLKERGHRVLIFSQFLDQLSILEDFLIGMELKFERLDGNQSSMEKQKKIDAFNAPDSKLFCMLLSTRAGGVGINLATADTVIILDPDWNPHQDIQALSRAHRIGQRKKVLCFQIMTVDSAEEKMLQIGRKKMALDHLLIESMDQKEGEAVDDVESVLKHGAAALFGEGQKKDAIKYDSAAVDQLLDRSMEEETKLDGDKSAESAFAFARVWAQDEGGKLTDDVKAKDETLNLSVWDNILRQREEEARREAEKNMETLGRGGRRRGAANYRDPRFDFEEAQDGAGGESDHGSADGDFVGGDDSDGDSSENENKTRPGTPVQGEFGAANGVGSNSKKSSSQGKGGPQQGMLNKTPKKLTPNTKRATTTARNMAGKPISPATPRSSAGKQKQYSSSHSSSQASSSRKGQNTSLHRPKPSNRKLVTPAATPPKAATPRKAAAAVVKPSQAISRTTVRNTNINPDAKHLSPSLPSPSSPHNAPTAITPTGPTAATYPLNIKPQKKSFKNGPPRLPHQGSRQQSSQDYQLPNNYHQTSNVNKDSNKQKSERAASHRQIPQQSKQQPSQPPTPPSPPSYLQDSTREPSWGANPENQLQVALMAPLAPM